jgi:hypothetical protein
MTDSHTIFDPFLGKEVVIVDRLADRLRGNYACGPHLPNGRPEFGFRQFQSPPIQHEAAAVIEALVQALRALVDNVNDYERVNNLAPSPGRTECWDTVARAKALLAVVGSARSGS